MILRRKHTPRPSLTLPARQARTSRSGHAKRLLLALLVGAVGTGGLALLRRGGAGSVGECPAPYAAAPLAPGSSDDGERDFLLVDVGESAEGLATGDRRRA